jgi:hypothetical protein
MAFCSQCGGQISEEDAFCSKCGTADLCGIKANSQMHRDGARLADRAISDNCESSTELSAEHIQKRSRLDRNYKLILLIFIGIATIGLVSFGLIISYNSYKENKAAEANELKEANLEDLMHLNICAKFTDSEQSRLESARNASPERLKVVLAQIHEERREFWLQRIKQIEEAIRDIKSQTQRSINMGYYRYAYISDMLSRRREEAQKLLEEAEKQASGFAKAVGRINNWKPITWDDYKKIKKI